LERLRIGAPRSLEEGGEARRKEVFRCVVRRVAKGILGA